jgi:hypothetical protein
VPSGFQDFASVIFAATVFLFFLCVLGYDLIFPEFEEIPGDDFLGICSYPVQFHPGKVWERFVLI